MVCTRSGACETAGKARGGYGAAAMFAASDACNGGLAGPCVVPHLQLGREVCAVEAVGVRVLTVRAQVLGLRQTCSRQVSVAGVFHVGVGNG